jgi:hypothetical protein
MLNDLYLYEDERQPALCHFYGDERTFLEACKRKPFPLQADHRDACIVPEAVGYTVIFRMSGSSVLE